MPNVGESIIMKYDKNYSIRMESCSASYEQTRSSNYWFTVDISTVKVRIEAYEEAVINGTNNAYGTTINYLK